MNLLLERITKKKKKKTTLHDCRSNHQKQKKKITFFTQLAYPDLHD